MNINRLPLDFNSLPAVIQGMIEDSSHAAAIIDELIQEKGENKALTSLIILDDMNIRGVQISSLYKMCNQNINQLYEKITSMNKDDIEKLNDNTFAICKYKALFEGTKEERNLNPDKYVFTDEERNEIRNKKSKDRINDILEKSTPKQKHNDLYPGITSKDALIIINRHGFKCGYKKAYENKNGKTEIYRVFYNELGDILYTHSLENPDIFLWGESKLKLIRISNNLENKECNTFTNIKDIKGYDIELRDKPFSTYQKVLNKNEKRVSVVKQEYFSNNYLPIIQSSDAIKKIINDNDYEGCVISYIYSLLIFPETYYDLDEGLKKIYMPLLNSAEEKAYDEIIYQLNSNEENDIIQKLQDILGINLDLEKIKKAKERYIKNGKKTKINFLKHLSGETKEEKKLNKKISEIAEKEAAIIK